MNKAEALVQIEIMLESFGKDGNSDELLKTAKQNPNHIFTAIEFKIAQMRKMAMEIELLSLNLNRAMSMELEAKQAVKNV